MKISMLSAMYPYRGGIAQFSANLYRELERQQHQVQAVTFKRQYPGFLFPGETQLVTENDSADPIPTEQLLDSINPLTYWKTARKIREFQPDLLLLRYWMPFFGPAFGTVAGNMLPQTKIVTIVDNIIPHEKRFFDAPANRYFLKRSDGFIVMSESVQNDLLSLKPNARCLLIQHPLYNHFGEAVAREKACAELGLDPSKKQVLFFGFIRDYKGLDLLLEATRNLSEDYTVIIAGEVYGTFDKYQEQIDRLGISDKVKIFKRYISDHEVPLFFSAADVCVLPYKSATQSGITSIAMHFGLPIIATDTGGLKELVHHNKTGLIVERPDSDLIGQALRDYFGKEMKQPFSEALKLEKAEHSWSNFATRLTDFAKEL